MVQVASLLQACDNHVSNSNSVGTTWWKCYNLGTTLLWQCSVNYNLAATLYGMLPYLQGCTDNVMTLSKYMQCWSYNIIAWLCMMIIVIMGLVYINDIIFI